ncbi:MAG: M56 family metallopeptidase, partial [Candidatus Hydrogenedentales bacterium]
MSSTLFSQEWAELAGAAVLNVMWQGVVVGAFAALALFVTRRHSPNVRYALSCISLLFVLALLPLNLAQHMASATPVQPLAISEPSDDGADLGIPSEKTTLIAPATTQLIVNGAGASRPSLSVEEWYALCLPWVGRIWCLGIVLFGLYDLTGILAIRRLRLQSRAVDSDIAALAQRVKERVGVAFRVQVRWLEEAASARVTGWFRVVILLPASIATRLAPDELEAILAHEFAHIRRWDLWANTLQRVVETLLFFHPVVWWLSSTIRTERELCCDEIALCVCPDRARYVR